MSSFRVFNRSVGRIISTVALVAAAVVPSFLPAMASAAQVTERSIALSTSTHDATNVTYNVTFTPATTVAAGGGIAVDFCTESPIVGDTCTAPTGFSASSAATSTSGYSIASSTTNRVNVAASGAMTSGTPVTVAVTGITNPTTVGQFYARIITYATSADATGDASTNKETGTGATDGGGVALSATDSIGVSGAVLEQMVFCVSGSTIAAGCTGSPSVPSLHLGTQIGNVYVISSDHSAPSTADVYTQISTNAAGGAVVSLKNSVTCGGMTRVGAAGCDIAPIATGGSGNGFTAGTAGFGVIANADTSTDTTENATGTFEIKPSSGYSSTVYGINYAAGGATGVTSAYGDPILDTNGTQPLNRNMKLTFGAISAPNTPAGNYSATLNLVATGTF